MLPVCMFESRKTVFTADILHGQWLISAFCRRPGMQEGAVGGELVAESTGGQISSRLLSMRSANALLELPQVLTWQHAHYAQIW